MERRVRAALGVVLLASGVVWSVMFPKKPSFDPEMVISVCIGVGLVGSGALLLFAKSVARGTAILCVLTLGLALANVCLLSELRAQAALLRALVPSTTSR